MFSLEETDDMQYPKFRKADVVEEKFGVKVADPYRYLEDDMSEESAEFVRIQNEFTEKYLSKIKSKDKVYEDLKEFYNFEKYAEFLVSKDRILFKYNTGLQNQFACYTKIEVF